MCVGATVAAVRVNIRDYVLLGFELAAEVIRGPFFFLSFFFFSVFVLFLFS